MHHVLLGYGYVAQYLALALSHNQAPILAFSRTPVAASIPHFKHQLIHDEHFKLDLPNEYVLYYFIPPPSDHDTDIILENYLAQLSPLPQKIIYIGSSGIYGDHLGHIVDEDSALHIQTSRQKGRLAAETQLQNFSKKHHIPLALLRVAGIYGPHRLPIEAASKQEPLIYPEEAPLINHIYVKDLVSILVKLGQEISYHGILNICDGHPQAMGTLQAKLASYLHYPPSVYQHFADVFAKASPMKREFMTQNKQLCDKRLKQLLDGGGIVCHDLDSGIQDCIENSSKSA
jgi:nucleoside-diphosphate-sugar epimerase